jgi:hypothetical protein
MAFVQSVHPKKVKCLCAFFVRHFNVELIFIFIFFYQPAGGLGDPITGGELYTSISFSFAQ